MTCMDKLPKSFLEDVARKCHNRCVGCGSDESLTYFCTSHFTVPASSGNNKPIALHTLNGVVLCCDKCRRILRHNEENPALRKG